MNNLLNKILEAHGGLDRWKNFKRVEATVVTGGGFFPFKGIDDLSPRRFTVELHEEKVAFSPFGAPDQRARFTPERLTLEKLDGTVVAERRAPRDSFAGHQMSTPWDAFHLACFSCEAIWTYLTTPFILAMPGVGTEEIEPWLEDGKTWRVLRAYFPGLIETHSTIQDFYFDDDLRLSRHDYQVNVAGGFGAAQLVSDYVTADGLSLPTKRRAYTLGSDNRAIKEMLMVSLEISEIKFE